MFKFELFLSFKINFKFQIYFLTIGLYYHYFVHLEQVQSEVYTWGLLL
jgi:hypothetical protein